MGKQRGGCGIAQGVIVLALGGGLAGSAVAQSAADTQIDACVTAGSGRVRVVEAAGACKRKERALSWSVAGPKGDQGQAGADGPPGTPGSDGPPPCHVVGRLTLSGITGDGPGGSMVVDAYHVVLEPGPVGGLPTVVDFSVTKPLDKASPMLATNAVLGTTSLSGTLEIFAADGVTVAITYSLGNVLITSIATGAPAACSSAVPTEDVSLTFTSLVVS